MSFISVLGFDWIYSIANSQKVARIKLWSEYDLFSLFVFNAFQNIYRCKEVLHRKVSYKPPLSPSCLSRFVVERNQDSTLYSIFIYINNCFYWCNLFWQELRICFIYFFSRVDWGCWEKKYLSIIMLMSHTFFNVFFVSLSRDTHSFINI